MAVSWAEVLIAAHMGWRQQGFRSQSYTQLTMIRLRLDPGNSPFALKNADLKEIIDWLMAAAMRRLQTALRKATIDSYFDNDRLQRALLPVKTWMTVYLNTHAYATDSLKSRGQGRIHDHPLVVNLHADLAVMEDCVYLALIAEAHDDTRGLVLTDKRAQAAHHAMDNWWCAFESAAPFG